MGHQLVLTIADILSDIQEVDPVALTPRLEECVSTDALQQLVNHDSEAWTLSFEFTDHEVTVSADGWVSVDGEQIQRWR